MFQTMISIIHNYSSLVQVQTRVPMGIFIIKRSNGAFGSLSVSLATIITSITTAWMKVEWKSSRTYPFTECLLLLGCKSEHPPKNLRTWVRNLGPNNFAWETMNRTSLYTFERIWLLGRLSLPRLRKKGKLSRSVPIMTMVRCIHRFIAVSCHIFQTLLTNILQTLLELLQLFNIVHDRETATQKIASSITPLTLLLLDGFVKSNDGQNKLSE